jgi:hypothetical protein
MRSLKAGSKLLAFASIILPAHSFDMGGLPPQAMENISKTPSCAMSCILDPHWAQKYAPECLQLPLGTEYGARLCVYQFMIDYCIKEKCNENDRKTVRKTLEDVTDE